MKKTISLIMLVLLSTIVLAAGMGVIVNQDFGNVRKGTTTQKTFAFYPFDRDNEGIVTVEVYTEGYIPHYQIEEGLHEVLLNEYTRLTSTLDIPRNAKKGDYSGRICAVGTCSGEGMCIRVGACTTVSYTITNKKK